MDEMDGMEAEEQEDHLDENDPLYGLESRL
jgi:hypothetical protein